MLKISESKTALIKNRDLITVLTLYFLSAATWAAIVVVFNTIPSPENIIYSLIIFLMFVYLAYVVIITFYSESPRENQHEK